MGGGAVVREVSTDQVSESLDLLIRSRKLPLRHIAEFREQVEGAVVAIAARRITENHRRVLDNLIAKARSCIAIDASADFLLVDKEIHTYFATITGNLLFISILKTIHENINRYYERFLVMDEREMTENLEDLEKLVQALSERNQERASELVKIHVRRFNAYMEAREQQAE